MLLRHMGAILS